MLNNYVIDTGDQTFTGNVTANTFTAATFIGNLSGTAGSTATVTGAAQPNITSVGTLTGLTTSAAINVNGFSIGNGGGTDNNSVWIGRLTASLGNTGTYNTVIGKQAASMLANGGNNTLIGAYAGGPITSGYGNSTLGANTLGSNTTGSYITAIGYISGGSGANANITGGYNTWLGALSGPGTTTQLTNSTAIGYGALNLNSNEMVLGNANLTSVITSASISAGGALKHFQQEIDASYTYNTPTTGQTVALASGTETAIINPSGTLAALTVTLPSCTSGYDGSIARFGIEQIITALTVNTTSGSVVGAATASTAGQGQAYICRGVLTTWFRIN